MAFRLHRTIFFWFGGTVIATSCLVFVLYRSFGGEGFATDARRAESFLSARFAENWDDPAKRSVFVASAERELAATISLVDRDGNVIRDSGQGCKSPWKIGVSRDGGALGQARICFEGGTSRGMKWMIGGAALTFLWMLTGRLAKRIVRPIGDVIRTADALASGQLDARVDVRAARNGEARMLGMAFNAMADRIAKQIEDQKALLATVSHELKTPLARIRFLTESARSASIQDEPRREQKLNEIEAEVLELDVLVSDLLASSRVDFRVLNMVRLDPTEVAMSSIEAAGADPTILHAIGKLPHFEGDPTLTVRALTNLLVNADKHANGATELVVREDRGHIVFEVFDNGAGLPNDTDVFAPFVRRSRNADSTGLGLALVRRIAEAHNGIAVAENRSTNGAVFRITFALRADRQTPRA